MMTRAPHSTALVGATAAVLTPTEDLVVDVLVARHRLGETCWSFSRRLRKTLDSLAARGLVSYDSGPTQGSYRVWPTKILIEEYLDLDHIPPALDPLCRAYYIGPRSGEFRVDCDRPRHGEEKAHRYRYPTSLDVKPVRWTEAEGYGYASALYGDQFRAADAREDATPHPRETAARIAAHLAAKDNRPGRR